MALDWFLKVKQLLVICLTLFGRVNRLKLNSGNISVIGLFKLLKIPFLNQDTNTTIFSGMPFRSSAHPALSRAWG
ncbi:hypothetical protein [Paenibacillus phytohabitans]|uniref:hypothetical protein n=1 Tax=Paenibacillus phytohabitans TaxID=2654978 RepID=UPI001492533E|nr:hypothetical protein [Paenibacillus phytohabitans]